MHISSRAGKLVRKVQVSWFLKKTFEKVKSPNFMCNICCEIYHYNSYFASMLIFELLRYVGNSINAMSQGE